ncbi:hypothetical protein M0813_16303 [Anaeramoeba flamelloides]|uniref:Uncharacterized protein n=1 Tax=Anaeramoeba flamelloides TaxID=1746091 RepID=A0ABQ8Z034_9EUKA|nr:hypothetical protein M0813_16303 [Anaeramoeba flamelloides]
MSRIRTNRVSPSPGQINVSSQFSRWESPENEKPITSARKRRSVKQNTNKLKQKYLMLFLILSFLITILKLYEAISTVLFFSFQLISLVIFYLFYQSKRNESSLSKNQPILESFVTSINNFKNSLIFMITGNRTHRSAKKTRFTSSRKGTSPVSRRKIRRVSPRPRNEHFSDSNLKTKARNRPLKNYSYYTRQQGNRGNQYQDMINRPIKTEQPFRDKVKKEKYYMDNYSQFERNLPKNKLYKYPKNDEYNNRERRVNYQNNDYQQFSREDHRSFDYDNNNHYPKFEDEENHNNIYLSSRKMHPSLYQKEISPYNRGKKSPETENAYSRLSGITTSSSNQKNKQRSLKKEYHHEQNFNNNMNFNYNKRRNTTMRKKSKFKYDDDDHYN